MQRQPCIGNKLSPFGHLPSFGFRVAWRSLKSKRHDIHRLGRLSNTPKPRKAYSLHQMLLRLTVTPDRILFHQ